MALYGGEAWGMRSAERRKVNVLEVKFLRSLVGVSRMDRVRNEEVRRRPGIERELESRADRRDRKSTRLNSSHSAKSRMPSSA